MSRAKIVKSSGNVFRDLGFPPEEAEIAALRVDLICALGRWAKNHRLTQHQVATRLGISQPRVSNLLAGKWEKFSVDTLLVFCARAGLRPRLDLKAA